MKLYRCVDIYHPPSSLFNLRWKKCTIIFVVVFFSFQVHLTKGVFVFSNFTQNKMLQYFFLRQSNIQMCCIYISIKRRKYFMLPLLVVVAVMTTQKWCTYNLTFVFSWKTLHRRWSTSQPGMSWKQCLTKVLLGTVTWQSLKLGTNRNTEYLWPVGCCRPHHSYISEDVSTACIVAEFVEGIYQSLGFFFFFFFFGGGGGGGGGVGSGGFEVEIVNFFCVFVVVTSVNAYFN